ncbi:MAG: hypothetical protein C0463_05115 [Idiomarina sp.]|nr:hypothetical protein [Idiomarina sp.]
MSELDKDQVLEDFETAYKKAHGKAPKVEANNGWYSVDGGKNMRLAQLDEWTQELKSSKSTAKPKKATKSKTKKSAGGNFAAESWQKYLTALPADCKPPRGMQGTRHK